MTNCKGLFFRLSAIMLLCTLLFCLCGCSDRESGTAVVSGEIDTSPNAEPKVVAFFGDSITARGSFENYFTNVTVVNLGLNGDTISGADERVQSVADANPDKIFLLVGINSLRDDNIEDCLAEYTILMYDLAQANIDSEIYVQSVLPISLATQEHMCSDETIRLFNYEIEQQARKFGLAYVDLYSRFAENGEIKAELTTDGLHLSDAGYEVWVKAIEKYVA